MIGFGDYSKNYSLEIFSKNDKRLFKIDTLKEGFYDNVLNYEPTNDIVNRFWNAIYEVKEVGVKPFYRAFFDPCVKYKKIAFKQGEKPAIGFSVNEWLEAINKMPNVKEKTWKIGSEYQYYAFLVALINRLVESGWEIEKAINAIVIDSTELGHYWSPEDNEFYFKKTGINEIYGFYDLLNAYKILSCTNKKNYYWLAGGACNCDFICYPLAEIVVFNCVDLKLDNALAWLVLS